MYSLSSCGAGGAGRTMNIVTYASPIAIKPARKYVVGLYVETLSWRNVKETGRCVLQARRGEAGRAPLERRAEAGR